MNKTAYMRDLVNTNSIASFEEIMNDTGMSETEIKGKSRWLANEANKPFLITDTGVSFGNTESNKLTATATVNKPHFDINKRFEFLEKLTKMVITGVQPALFIAGDGGLGKTYTVEKVIAESNASPVVIKGFSTAAGLYRLLHDNRDKQILFDDADSVFLDKVAANILKAATDSSDTRIVSYNAVIKDYEQSFEFTGQIIFISNLRSSQFPQALISRSTVANMDMTTEEKLQRIETVLPHIDAKCDLEVKEYTFNFIRKNVDRISDINFRTLIKLAKIFNQEGCNAEAEDLALFVACH